MSGFDNLLRRTIGNVISANQGGQQPTLKGLLNSEIGAIGNDRARFRRFRESNVAVKANQANRQRRALGAQTSMAVAREGNTNPMNFAEALNDATRRAGMRADIVRRGEGAIEAQSLRDRIAIARSGFARRGAATQVLQNAANIREGVNVGLQNAKEFGDRSRADMVGGIAGALTGVLSDKDSRQNAANLIGRIFGR